MRKPVVASNIDGIPELIENGKTGILTPAKDVSSLVVAIEDLLKNQSKAKQLGENARKKVFPKFSADSMVNRIEELYLRLLEKNACLNEYL